MKSKGLTVVGSFGEKSAINFILGIRTMINGICRQHNCLPMKTWFHRGESGFVSSLKEYSLANDKYTFPPFKTITHASPIILDNCFSKVVELASQNNSPLKRFVKIKTDIFTLRIIPSNVNVLFYEINYAEIKESVIAYLIGIGQGKLAAELREEFKGIKSDAKDSNTLIDEKVKELLSLDLSNYAASISGKKGKDGGKKVSRMVMKMDKTKMVCVRLTDDELSYIDSKALSLGLSRSRYIAEEVKQ